nr:MAG TPA: hypothetical protein [Caudoviricetes sp.]
MSDGRRLVSRRTERNNRKGRWGGEKKDRTMGR